MGFVYILIFVVFLSHTLQLSLVRFLIENLTFIHLSCIKFAPDNVRSLSFLQALVCGKNISDPNESQILIASGLIHLFVVSGSHLQLLRRIMLHVFSKKFELIILAALFLYCAVCNFNPPIVRSFVALAVVMLTRRFGLKWREVNLILISGVICLAISPQWTNSLSLQMSWIAALTLIIIQLFYQKSNPLVHSAIFYIQYLITFNFIGLPSLLAIPVSTLFTRFLEYVLFPLSLLTYGLPFLSFVFDFTIEQLVYILRLLDLETIFRIYDSEKVVALNWLFIFTLHFLISYWKSHEKPQLA